MRSYLTVERICEQCGSTFQVNKHKVNHGRGRFCSRACANSRGQRSLAERFWEKVNKNGPVPPHCPELGPCWLWTGANNKHGNKGGYGFITMMGRGMLLAHRISWELYFGPIQDGLHVLHHCDTPPCVRPSHLFLGTGAANTADMLAKHRQSCGEDRWNVKLTAVDIQAIRLRHAAGEAGLQELANEFHLHPSHVWRIVTRKAWQHI